MLSQTLTSELGRYKIGARIKALRLSKKLGLVQLSAHTGLSTAMLSKIERGQLFPTLPTLLRIALVFGVDLDHFFSKAGHRVAITRKGERIPFPMPPMGAATAYSFESLDYPLPERRMEAFLAEFPINGVPSEPHEHGSEEFLYVLAGAIGVTINAEETVLAEGDAISFASDVPHSYRRLGKEPCRALVVTTS